MESADALDHLSPTERISKLLETVESGSPRHGALGAALDFKGSWIELAGHLKEVEDNELWREWEYSSLADYCKNELQLGRGEIRKLREGYEWIQNEAPELLDGRDEAPGGSESDAPRRPAPDMDTVGQLARGWQDYEKERIPEDTYLELKRAALRGERSAYQLRREFKDAVPEHLRETPPPNPRKHLKRALDALEKALNEIEQSDGEDGNPELFERARQLRDEIFHLVAVKEE
jgi:hypothetical protein